MCCVCVVPRGDPWASYIPPLPEALSLFQPNKKPHVFHTQKLEFSNLFSGEGQWDLQAESLSESVPEFPPEQRWLWKKGASFSKPNISQKIRAKRGVGKGMICRFKAEGSTHEKFEFLEKRGFLGLGCFLELCVFLRKCLYTTKDIWHRVHVVTDYANSVSWYSLTTLTPCHWLCQHCVCVVNDYADTLSG